MFQHKDQDAQQLQQDLDSLAKWSVDWNPFFNTNKFIHLSFNLMRDLLYHTVLMVPQLHLLACTHRDLGIIISSILSWNQHYNSILAKAYRTLGLLRRTFSNTINIQAKNSLYISLARSQLSYCSQIWHPYLLCDITALE